jgi:large subunit ribosomal protein L10
VRPEKKAIIEEIRVRLDGTSYVLLADCRGLKSAQLTELRRRLRRMDARLQVVSNSLLDLAAKERGWELQRFLDGPTAMVVGKSEVTEVAKVLAAFTDANGGLPKVKGGILDASPLSAADFVALSKMESRDVLLSKLVGVIAAPATRLAGVLNQKLQSLVFVLKAIETKKAGGQK